jgi:hypothetical protein
MGQPARFLEESPCGPEAPEVKMLEVNLITSCTVTIQDLELRLRPHFECMLARCDRVSLKIEKLPSTFINELYVRDGDRHALVLDKPSALSEYVGDELDFVTSKIPSPKVFVLALSDEHLLERILLALTNLDVVIVDDTLGNLRVVGPHSTKPET